MNRRIGVWDIMSELRESGLLKAVASQALPSIVGFGLPAAAGGGRPPFPPGSLHLQLPHATSNS